MIPNLIEIDKTIEFMHFVVTAENQEKHIQKLGTSQGINRSSYKIENINRAWQYQEYLIEKAKGSDIKIVENNYTIEKIDNAIIEILKKQKKKILVIDTMGVLFPNVVDGSRIKLTDLYNRLTEPRVDYETFYSKYKELIIGQISIERFWQDISSDKDDRSQIEKEHLDTYEIHTDIKNIVNKLKEDYIIVTLTNHPRKWMDYIAQKFNLHEILDYIYLSEDFKDEKPSQALYQRILELHNVVATEAILVDDQSKNLISASQIGMITVKCNTTKEDNAFIPNYEINDFSEITDIIDSKVL
ncbi:MAG: HAD family hydrolase [Oscillospiraceae bacterium]|nr:HAD family hydrolase [Oscillospiraceae bacterium]